MNIIETKGLAHKQGSRYLLKNIDWTVKEKEKWIVFGINGCGKTTLLSTVCGYRGHNKGEVFLFGNLLTNKNAVELRSQTGFVSASYMDRCFHNESTFDVVLSAKFGGFGRREMVTDADVIRARNLLKSLGVAERGDYPYDMLSQGQRQRVLLARSLMVPPKLLVFDEPLIGLDIMARDFFLNTLREIESTTDTTIIYVTHHAEEILPFYTKALLLKNGEIFSKGNIEDVFSENVLTEYFGQKTKAKWYGDHMYIEIGNELRMNRAIWETKEGV